MKPMTDKKTFVQNLMLYRPLIVMFLFSVVMGFALAAGGRVPFMSGIMGLFFCFLSVLKFFDLRGFAEGFARYDIAAQKSRGYAFAYPFIELGLGCLYLSGTTPLLTNLATIIVMTIGTVGVVKVIRAGIYVQCACAGTGFSLPVGKVTLLENTAMGVMALINIINLLIG
jgi:hypothetical protein